MATNIVVFVSDDHPYFDGSKILNQMSFFKDKFKDNGVFFTRMRTAVPRCAPDRGTLLTGLIQDAHGIIDNDYGPFDPTQTIATALQGGGYQTHLIGKYINRYAETADIGAHRRVPPGWSSWYAFRNSEYLSYTIQKADVGHDGSTSAESHAASNTTVAPKTDGTQDTGYTGDYSTRVLAQRAWTIINNVSGSLNTPLFLWISPTSPHPPYTIEGWWQAGNDGTSGFVGAAGNWGCSSTPCTLPPSYNIVESDKPTWMQSLPVYGGGNAEDLTDDERVMQSFDDLIQQVFNKMATDGRQSGSHSTLYLFVSDNGRSYGEHRLDKKNVPHLCAAHVPFAAHWVNGSMRAVPYSDTVLWSTIDIAPTIADVAGVTLPYSADGVSFKNTITGQGAQPNADHRFFSIATSEPDNSIPLWSGVENNSGIRYWKYPHESNSPEPNEELYDINADPWELTNRANDGGSWETTRSQMADLLESLQGNFDNRIFCKGKVGSTVDNDGGVVTVTVGRDVPVGDHVVVIAFASDAAADTLTVTDSQSNTWTTHDNNPEGDSFAIYCASSKISTALNDSPADTITLTFSGAVTDVMAYAFHFTGMATSNWFKGKSLLVNDSGTEAICGAVTRGVSGLVLGAFSYATGGGNPTEGAGWRQTPTTWNATSAGTNARKSAVVWNVPLPLDKTTYQPAITLGSSAGWRAKAYAFEQASPPAVTATPVPTVLAAGASTTDGTQYDTAPFTPVANQPVYVLIHQRVSGAGPSAAPTSVTFDTGGTPITATSIRSKEHAATTQHRLSAYRFVDASPNSAAVRMIWAATQTAVQWIVVQWDGADNGGSNGANSVVASYDAEGGAAVTTLSPTMSAFSHVNNALFVVTFHSTNEFSYPDWGLRELADVYTTTPNVGLHAYWRKGGANLTPRSFWATGSNAVSIAIEVKAEAESTGGSDGLSRSDGTDFSAAIEPYFYLEASE